MGNVDKMSVHELVNSRLKYYQLVDWNLDEQLKPTIREYLVETTLATKY